MTENIMLQETEMTKTGFCEICNAKTAELVCEECGNNICHFCNANTDDSPVCDVCEEDWWERDDEEDEDDDE